MQSEEVNGTRKVRLQVVGFLAAMGVGVVGIGELMMHWTGSFEVGSGNGAFAYLIEISRARLVGGHFLSVLVAPIYFLGYWQVTQRLSPAPRWIRGVFFGLCIYVLTMASIWIGSRAYLGRSLQIVTDPGLRSELSDEYSLLLESLIWILRVGMIGISTVFVYLVVGKKTSYPRWMAVCNPFVLLLLVFSTMLIPSVGPHLVPAALNVAHVPFFLFSAFSPYVIRRGS